MTFAKYPSLAGRTVFVSGGATGIGAEIVRAFARNHAKTAFVDIQAQAGEALAEEIGGAGETALFLKCDVTDIDALRAAIKETRQRLGAHRRAGQQRRQRRAARSQRSHSRILGPHAEREPAPSILRLASRASPDARTGIRLDRQPYELAMIRRSRDNMRSLGLAAT